MQKIRVEDAQAKHPPDEPRVGGFGIARKQDSEETKISGLDETTPEAPIQSNARTDAASEENEEEWLLKSIQWPPLPPRPSSSPTQSFETSDLRTKIIQQNRNGPCSLIALCNVLILRDDLHIPPGRDRVTYSYLSTLLADFFLRITSTSPVPPVSAVPENDPTLQSNARQLSLEAALSILPQTRYGLNLNPQFSRIDGFTTSASSGQGELALFSLAQIPLLNGWIADPADQETFEVLTEAKDYDRAVEMMVEGSEIAGRLGLQGQGGDDLSEDELLKEAERRSQWTSEEEAKVRKAHLIDRFLDLTSTQLTYPGLFALSSTPTFLPPAGLAALFRNSHLSVIYRRPRTPTANELSAQTRGPELFALVTDSSFAGEEEIVWESIEDVDGSASEFFTAGLERSRARGGDFAGVRRVEDVPESTSRRNELADLALAQQLQAEEEHEAEEYERAEHIRQVQRAQQQETATSARRPSDPRAHATSAGGRTEAGKAKSKAEKDKCLIM
ncbi:MINDY family deubiquitinase [Sporobolomyces koalae]|uniref:MINDY family deubiquitinase n=1 Tax=Sporobolomyces koalae TaxID=500713 RepID=UPI00316D9383